MYLVYENKIHLPGIKKIIVYVRTEKVLFEFQICVIQSEYV